MSAVGIMAGLISLISMVLIVHKNYEDGLIGRIALSGLVLSGVVIIAAELADGAKYEAPLEIILLLACVVIFLARHLYRFIVWSRTGSGDWRKLTE